MIDHELQTAVHKPSGFDLLNENCFPEHRAPSKLSPHIHHVLFFKQQKEFLPELKITCANRLKDLEKMDYFEHVKPYNFLAAIKDTITILTSKERLLAIEYSIKNNFKPLFQPIPHVNQLPTDVMANINFKNAYNTIKNRTYSCPHQLGLTMS